MVQLFLILQILQNLVVPPHADFLAVRPQRAVVSGLGKLKGIEKVRPLIVLGQVDRLVGHVQSQAHRAGNLAAGVLPFSLDHREDGALAVQAEHINEGVVLAPQAQVGLGPVGLPSVEGAQHQLGLIGLNDHRIGTPFRVRSNGWAAKRGSWRRSQGRGRSSFPP